ncbi:molybdopterin-guanine dinucleotide biosynthesis protein [Cryobacterium adonitolivorans]|uniref:Molybdopterin-guanine dinucleotide biosynthesis protein n=1 Tax=Cryobacterium adonitolivorans TaxID=1259189 RepID=A0A4R8W0U4_9MICO|nr:NTP transferase domain-containing protein [Cryobacterium adonitolivorans]TFC00390.1 molybdopterin-guanine dinucleotide biosynthesis protein [Cryobacterium adonitolivorans]
MPRHDTDPTPASAAGQGGAGQGGAGQGGAGREGAGRQWDAIIVAGGRARRLDGIDKTALVWRGRSLLDGVLAAASGARRTCVVGSDRSLPAGVLRAVEQPRWGGPAAAIVAGLEALARESGGAATGTDWIVVLAGDLIRAENAVPLLLAELDRLSTSPDVDGLISVDAGGRRQPLLAVYRRAALVSAAAMRPAENLSVTSLIGALTLVELRLPDALGDDVDTPADAARLGIVIPASAAPPGTPQQEP